MKILTAAGVVIDGAIKVLAFAKRFTEKNTPECALAGTLITLYQSVQAGALPTGAAVISAVVAITIYMTAEQGSDAKKTVAGTP